MWTLHGFLFNVLCIESELRSQFVLFHGNPSNPSNDIHMHCMEAGPWFHGSHACIIYFFSLYFFLIVNNPLHPSNLGTEWPQPWENLPNKTFPIG